MRSERLTGSRARGKNLGFIPSAVKRYERILRLLFRVDSRLAKNGAERSVRPIAIVEMGNSNNPWAG